MTADQVMAGTLHRIWRYEHASRSEEEEQHRMMLAREVHAGNPEVWPEVEELIAVEREYLDARAREYVDGLPAGERRRWERLLGVDAID